MRLYTFCNFYLSSIQQGIQPAHVVADMFVRYDWRDREDPEKKSLFDWARDHKTMICLNGGNAAGIRELWEKLQPLGQKLSLAHGFFREDEQSLDKTMTCVGIIVPARIYEYNEFERTRDTGAAGLPLAWALNPIALDETEQQLASLIASYGLAK